MQRYMWQRLVESSSDAICIHTHTGVFEYVSPSTKDILQHRPGDLIGKEIQEFVHPDDRTRVQRTISRLFQKPNGTHMITYRVAGAHGRYVWVEANCSLIRTRGERPRVLCTVRNIEQRKRAEEKVHRRSEKLSAMVSTPKTLMWLSGELGERTQFNEAWLQFTGRTLNEEMGRGWLRNVHGRDRSRCEQTISKHVRSLRPYEQEFRIRYRDGTYRWLRELAVPRFSEHATFMGYQGSCFDITDIKEAELKLKRKKEELARLKFALDRLADHIVIADVRGTIIYANEAATRTTGFSREEMIGKKHGSKELWGGNMTREFYEQLWGTLKKRSETFEGHVLNKRKSGEYYGALLRIHPISTKAGGVKYFAAFETEVPISQVDPEYIASNQEDMWSVARTRAKRRKGK